MMKRAPASYNMPRNKHKQAAMFWQGEAIKVDAEAVKKARRKVEILS